ncbi:MAG TPA: phosphoribosylglycinamide formyltransferase [Elusimicrobia bacterium]|nr:MAG: phosphoribosylglycinamide formyltransferase [Elusimicrobia bacterium GWA2_51_34]HAF96497.1 phosphoribosylglycinamide formyltransferase [Elusimicrobiota bacterium]HCE97576.1 phosphoribosylglycinamide formyltransferase [Elusimicrobiota bacterium]
MVNNFNITVCASGNGGNLQSLIDNQGKIGIRINMVIVDRKCGAIDRAVNSNIPYKMILNNQYVDNFLKEIDANIPPNTDLVVLAGFFPVLDVTFCKKWKNKIINTHPSLLPKYGGKGMYGVRVQEAVMRAKEKYAGCTVHYVTPEIDGGAIILQKVIEVDYTQTPRELGGRIHMEENKLLVNAISLIKNSKI